MSQAPFDTAKILEKKMNFFSVEKGRVGEENGGLLVKKRGW